MIPANPILKFLLLAILYCMPGNLVWGQNRPVSQPKIAHTVFNGHSFDVYTVDFPKESIQMFWKNGRGDKLMSIEHLKEYVESKGRELVFATNAGMYMEDNTPLGLYIENGKQFRPLKLSTKGNGNFYMQPNGVFLLTRTKARVVTSAEFHKYKGKVIFATQSGPMLVTGGKINTNFTPGSANINIRSGVGITRTGKVVFAISDDLVNFYDFARLFKDSLECDDALYLDGAISRMYIPALKRLDLNGSFGAMIGVVK